MRFNESHGYYYIPNIIVVAFHDDPPSEFIWQRNGLAVTSYQQINSILGKFGVSRVGRVLTGDSMFVVYCAVCDAESLVDKLAELKSIFKFAALHNMFELTNCIGGGILVDGPEPNQSLLNQISAQCV